MCFESMESAVFPLMVVVSMYLIYRHIAVTPRHAPPSIIRSFWKLFNELDYSVKPTHREVFSEELCVER